MKFDTNLLSLEHILLEALGRNSLTSTKIIKSKTGTEFLFLQSSAIAVERQHKLNNGGNEVLVNALDCINNDKTKLVVQISMVEFAKLSYSCEFIAAAIKKANISLILVIDDYSTLNLEIGLNPFKVWSSALGLSLSQHPNRPSMFLVDLEYRFHERLARLSRYEEITKPYQVTDKNHKDVLYFRMEEDLVKRFLINETYLLESIKDLSNFAEIHSSLFGSNSREGGIYCDETGIFIRRPYINGTSLKSFLEFNSSKEAAKLLIVACCKLSKMKYFPNDLRPWNLVYQQNQCFLIDFPKNLNCDDDVIGLPNFISLLVILEYMREIHTQSFDFILSKLLYSICNHAAIYNVDSFSKLESAWLNLENYVDLLMLFEDGKISVEIILNEVIHE
jgi:hypothetical protein